MNKFILLILVFVANFSFSQGDDCFNATSLGSLPAPPNCPSGGGAATNSLNYSGTTNGATAENPYSSLACMDAPAADVWVTFTATGNEMDLDFTSGLSGANIGIYTGDCTNGLTGLFCENSNNGNISTTLTPFVPGETYYMQISGADATDFSNFTLDMTATNNCDLCVLSAGITASPAPTNGFYTPGTTVEFCMTINEFDQVSANWLAGVVPSFGSSWDMSTLTPISSPTAGNGYVWVWDTHPTLGEGWFVDEPGNGNNPPDGDLTNNFGDPDIDGTGTWTFCFEITTSTNCTSNGDLSASIDTYSDYETGGYGTPGCSTDPVFPFTAFMLCCEVPLSASTDETCPGAADGTISVTGQGGTAPYDYVFENSSGTTVYTENNVADVTASTATGLVADTYTITVTDDNGCEQIIDVEITAPPCPFPTMDPAPADVTVECIGDVPAMTSLTWNDLCQGSGTVVGTDVSNGLTCPEIITRTWTFTNNCGNSVTDSQVITVDDTTPPVFAAAPADVTVECIGDVPAMTNLDWTDNCDGTGSVAGTDGALAGGPCGGTITRTWTYTDACGNPATATQTITVDDTTPPVFAAAPADVTVECIGDVPAMTNLGWTDNCDGTGSVAGTDGALAGGSCGGTITRTWTYTDACGNPATTTQAITVDDTTPPVFAAAPADVTVECIGDVPAMTNLGWTDNCDGAGNVAGTDGALAGGPCGGTITRTWTYTDACGNPATATQTITIDDNTAPVFAAAPADVTVECIGDVPAMTNLDWTDNCDGTGSVAGTDGALAGGPCGGTITRTWTYTDACGNPATATQTITIDDNTAPVFAAAPADVTVECIGDVPAMTNLGWTDNCDGAGNVAGTDGALAGGPCGGTITRTWTYTDACGNPATATQIITVDDTTPPVFAAAPADVTVECIGDVPAMTNLGWTDNCDGAGSVAGTDGALAGGPCGGTITRTWTYTDVCGNPATATQTITIDDNTAPVFAAAPADVTVECIGDVPAMTNLDWTDNCDGTGSVAGTDGALAGGPCGGTITRTWTYTDVCGNPATATQIITVDDTTPPVFAAAPADVTVECIGDVPAMTNLDWTDNCDGTGSVAGTDGALAGGPCGGTITRTWTYTDVCGNPATATQIITIDDNIAPVAAAPAAVTVQCAADVPAVNIADVTATDNCGVPTVTHVSDVSDGNLCPEVITRTYEIVDACGNTVTVTQEITVDDTTPPTASNPAPISATGSAPAPDVTVVNNEADNCTANPAVVFVDDVTDGLNCPETITRTYSVTDDCGNQILVEQTITIGDAIIPTASNPDPISVQCAADVPVPDETVVDDEADNGAQPIVTWEDDTSDNQTCPETITRRYRVTDDCGNFIFVEQIITINDDVAPLGTAPLDETVQCAADVPVENVNDVTGVSDNCTANPLVTFIGDASDGQTCPETITRTYRITDDCGNTTDVTQTITINDDIAPLGTAPLDETVQCVADVPVENVNDVTGVSDNCTANPLVTFVGDASDGLTCPETITRTYRITDDCGNTTDITQTITINDDIAPTGTAPLDATLECPADVPVQNTADVSGVSDNCTANPLVTFVGDASDGQTCPETITRTYRITDDCGNTTDVTQTITIEDITAPVITGTLATITDEGCTVADATVAETTVAGLEVMGATIADNCTSDANLTVTSTETDAGTCPIVITRVYTVTDECGNATTINQTLNVNDTQAPTASNPATTTVECATDVPAVDETVVNDEADNCTAAPTVTFLSEVSDNNVCDGEQIVRTYQIEDDCGNTTTVTHTIIIDSYTPTFTVAGTDPTVCGGTDGFITISGLDPNTDYSFSYNGGATSVITTDGAGEYVITGLGAGSYTGYTVSDADCPACSTTDGATITLIDPNPPAIDAGVDQQVCEGDQVTLTADNPDGATITWDNGITDGTAFTPAVGTTTYTVTANLAGCINSDAVNVTVAPTIDDLTCPGGLTAVCDITEQPAYADFYAFIADGGSATIPAGGVIDTASFVMLSEVSDGLTCPETVTRTYQIADTCGVTVTCTQTIVINDLIDPTGTAPAALAVQCIGDVPVENVNDVTGVSDNCTANPAVTFEGDVSDGQTCPETITRTYRITDDCGNFIEVDQIITVNDDIDPTGTAPAAVAVQCIGDVPVENVNDVTGVSDNCTANPAVTFEGDVSDGNTCPETITRTYRITDDCGNFIEVDQIITVNDDIDPTGTAPAALAVQCIGDVSVENVNDVTGVSDNCTANPAVTFEGDVSDGNTCPETITRTYRITDDCGNFIEVDQIITVNDDIDPTGTAPAALAVQCIGDVPVENVNDVTGVSDNCTANPAVTFEGDVSDGQTCPETITRTYRITDDCGNFIEVDQIITVNDDIDPTGTAPAAVAVQCIGDVPVENVNDVTGVSDNCTANPAVTFEGDVSDGNTCPETITRTYRITDDCGNFIEVDQIITVNDDIDPTGTAPAAVAVQCIGDVPVENVNDVTGVSDNCTAAPAVTHVGDVSDGNTCPETITRTYRITDDCGNFIEVDQIITVNDDIDPTASAPAPVAVQCIGDVPVEDVTVITDEADNCTAAPAVTHVGDVSDGNTCPEVITRTYRIEDACGNFIEVDQIITVNDDIAPTASNPATTTVLCVTDVPAVDETVVTDEADNCTVAPTVTFISETSDNNVCNGEELTRVYEIEDDCGNTTTVTHTIIIDSYTPTFTVAGTDPTLCGANDGFITITGLNPNESYDISYNGNAAQTVNTDANGEYVITGLTAGSYTDFTINLSSCPPCQEVDNTNINLVDPNAPVVNAGPDQEVCEGTDVTLTADNPDGANISWDNGVTDGTPFTPGVGTVNYTVTAELAGCISTDLVVVTVNPLPTVNAGNDIAICEGDQVTLSGSGAASYAWDNGVTNGVAFTPSSTTTYTVTGTSVDGCVNTDDVVVTVNSNPAVSFEADNRDGCTPLTVNFTNLTAGNSTECVYTFSDGTQLIGCNPTHTFTAPGCYDVTLQVTNDNGCVSTTTIQDYICVEGYPVADFTVDPGELTNLNNTAQFTNNSSGASTYEWQFGDGGTSTVTNPEHTYPATDDDDFIVQLIAYSDYGCPDTATTILPLREELIFYVPNTFTPDNDDYNETFKPVFTAGFDPFNYQLLIFNRWGEVIFESNNAEIGWDGTYGADNQDLVKDGTYVWKIVFKTKYKDERQVEIGHVNVLK